MGPIGCYGHQLCIGGEGPVFYGYRATQGSLSVGASKPSVN